MELPQMGIIYSSFALFLLATAYQYIRPKEERKYTSLSVEEARDRIKSGNVYIVDVRRRDEFRKGHLRKAKNIPLDEFTDRLNKIPKKRDVLVYCDTGARSIRAVRYLEVAGHEGILHMHQGMRGWRKAGFPVA
jgi:rhodanese-related sulfurtransferase